MKTTTPKKPRTKTSSPARRVKSTKPPTTPANGAKRTKASPKPAESRKPAARKPKAPATKSRAAKPPEVRRAVAVEYFPTIELNIREGPGTQFAELPGGPLLPGARLVPIAQPWWLVEVAGTSKRGWVHSGYLRPAGRGDVKKPRPKKPEPQKEKQPSTDTRLAAARQIVNFEARRDKAGHLRVYSLPAGDGGGRYEVAGINDRYHPREAAELANLIQAGKFDDAEQRATEIIAEYTDQVAGWSSNPAIQAFLRDSAFNRGPGGAAKILQLALEVEPDGKVGEETLAALQRAEAHPEQLLMALRAARERYELRVAGRRPQFWKGLVNRWDNALAFSESLIT